MAAAEAVFEQPAPPTKDSVAAPTTAAEGAHKDEDTPKLAKKAPLTDPEREIQALRQARVEQRKRLVQIRKDTRKAKRRASALNKKAAKISMEELMSISLLKYRALLSTGEVAETDALMEEEEASGGSSSSSTKLSEKAFGIVAALAKKKKEQPTA